MTVSSSIEYESNNLHFDGLRGNLQDAIDAQESVSDWLILDRVSIDSTTLIASRQLVFTMYDDAQLVDLIIKGQAAATAFCYARIQAVDDDGNVVPGLFPADKLELPTTLGTSVVDARAQWDSNLVTKHWLLAGVTYRLEIEVVTASVTVNRVLAQVVLDREARRA